LDEEYTIKDVVFYLLNSLGGSVSGLRKLMKLVFLVQYERGNNEVIKYLYGGRPVTRTEFFIWSHGPFSNEVYEVADKYLEIDDEKNPPTFSLPGSVKVFKLPEPVRKRVDLVAITYGGLSDAKLDRLVRRSFLLDEQAIDMYRGLLFDDYAKEVLVRENIKLREVDIG